MKDGEPRAAAVHGAEISQTANWRLKRPRRTGLKWFELFSSIRFCNHFHNYMFNNQCWGFGLKKTNKQTGRAIICQGLKKKEEGKSWTFSRWTNVQALAKRVHTMLITTRLTSLYFAAYQFLNLESVAMLPRWLTDAFHVKQRRLVGQSNHSNGVGYCK